MSMTLYGSGPSPFVRRIRLLLEGVEYDFIPINIMEDKDLETLEQVSPIRKLPVLIDNDKTLMDSHLICDYLLDRFNRPALDIEARNQVHVIDAVTDSLVIRLLGDRSGLDITDKHTLFKLQNQRIPVCLDWVTEQINDGAFNQWNYPMMALLAMVEWAEFRDLYDFSPYTCLKEKVAEFQSLPIVSQTAPA